MVAYTSKASWYASALAPTFFANGELDNAYGGRARESGHSEHESKRGNSGVEDRTSSERGLRFQHARVENTQHNARLTKMKQPSGLPSGAGCRSVRVDHPYSSR